jgi:hypothetical protein
MRSRKFVPGHDNLEDRNLLSALPSVHVARVTASNRFSSPSSGLPFVFAPPGVPQSSINMTTHTFNQIIYGNFVRGGGRITGLNTSIADFTASGDANLLNSRLTILASRVPFGTIDLLPRWQLAAAAGSSTSRLQAATQRILINYINDGVQAGDFNYLQSVQRSSTDGLIANNGKVGRTPLD